MTAKSKTTKLRLYTVAPGVRAHLCSLCKLATVDARHIESLPPRDSRGSVRVTTLTHEEYTIIHPHPQEA